MTSRLPSQLQPIPFVYKPVTSPQSASFTSTTVLYDWPTTEAGSTIGKQFTATPYHEGLGATANYQSISALQEFREFSFEELRREDYKARIPKSSSPQTQNQRMPSVRTKPSTDHSMTLTKKSTHRFTASLGNANQDTHQFNFVPVVGFGNGVVPLPFAPLNGPVSFANGEVKASSDPAIAPATDKRDVESTPGRKVWEEPPSGPDEKSANFLDDGNQLKRSRYECTSGKLMEILSSLHQTGVQREIDLPQIAVLGSQSVGKSSLIESISGIKLPRDTGTCTRCPMEIRLQRAKSWSCQVVLRFHTDNNGTPLEAVKEVAFGDTMASRDFVRERIRRAQRAILHPNMDSILFLNEVDPQTSSAPLSFSYNCVCVRVAGPDIPDLYFYDLPGVIANVQDGGDENDIERTKHIAQQYIKRRNCLILLAISCETDFENQSAGRLVLLDPELRAKTIGVLTKADRIEGGASKKWQNMVEGKENLLTMQWFVVKQPNPNELQDGISWEEARAREEDFFSQEKPWSSLSGERRAQLGSQQLSKRLGEHLSNLIAKTLPGIRNDIIERLVDVDKQLLSIPPPIHDPHRKVCDLIMGFSQEMEHHVQGRWESASGRDLGLIQSLRKIFVNFQASIAGTAPRMRPWIEGKSKLDEKVMLKLAKEEEEYPLGSSGHILYLHEVLNLAIEARTRELPGNTPFDVKAHLIHLFISRWQSLADACFEKAEELMTNRLNKLVTSHFKAYSHNGLTDAVLVSSQAYMLQLKEKTHLQLLNILELEELPFTLNDHYFHDYKRKMAARYEEIYHVSTGNLPLKQAPTSDETQIPPGSLDEIIGLLNSLPGFENVGRKQLLSLQSSNDAVTAIEIMAETRAYFQVAYKRYTDVVALQIDRTLVREFGRNLRTELLQRLDIFGERGREICTLWLAEDPFAMERRKDLLSRQHILRDAMGKLHSVSF